MSEEDTGAAPAAPERVVIGISFGNSNSSIAFTSKEGKAEVIANEDGDRQIPSVLSYVQGEEYHGTQAKTHLVRNGKDTIAYFRDFLGHDYKSIDPTQCHASAHPIEYESTVAFSIQESAEEGTRVTITVSEVTTRHLRRLASSASDFLGKRVNAAVITVPTDFSKKQRNALVKAAKDAGIDILQIIHEPIAAVLGYDARPDAKVSDKVIVVADFGGTRSDVTVIASRGGMYTILATVHDYSLGGTNLDQALIDYFAKEFMKKHKTDPRENPRSLAKLKLETEATKKALSLGTSGSFSVESLADGIDYSSTINKTRYELLAGKVFAGFIRLVEQVIQKAELDVLDVDEVILSGGASHTPKVARLLQSTFPEKTSILAPSTSATAINPSELAARGAAIQANLIQEFEKEDIEQSTHPMVTATPHLAHAIGVLVISSDERQGIFKPLMEAETAVPVRRHAQFATPKEGGDVLIRVCEGLREIKVHKPESRQKINGNKSGNASDGDEEDSDISEDEEEEVRQVVWNAGKVLAEAAITGVKKGGKIEVGVNVGEDLSLSITAREVGGKGGVRGVVERPKAAENGSA
ncbi:MAG: Hsp70 protein that interacts with Zuo1p [Geoglossum umbratile]|nr:MAG: Hsp70 protein that interacts with Zuo1p [Geoglossum umbratile]